MASPLELLCMISALAATGYSLQCTKCLGLGLSSCTEGPTITCPLDQVCTTLYQIVTSDGKMSESVFRSCGPKTQCNNIGSLTIAGQRSRMGVTCCSTDNCTSATPLLPPANNQKSGKVCQSCRDGNEACSGPETMQCFGSEDQCLLQVVRATGSEAGVESYRGCTTKSICNIGSQTIELGALSIEMKFFCNSGTIRLYNGLFISTTVVLLLLKLPN